MKDTTEYAVEVNRESDDRFLRQIDVFESYKKAEEAIERYENENILQEGEYFNIIFIDYDEIREKVLKNTDYYTYEASLDEWNCLGCDVIELCEKQMEYIETVKRVNKDTLYEAFSNIIKEINKIM